ncbi:hypothetical protein [Streptomyces gobiensis]|uniref:COG4315 family predicted lipoprotein n=1 Tax=Streptomyces gobiensis TaxID=2875706 RepID=UPI001E4F2AAA|nr:hypothetical protein [Streptomyces gobiensis]UGY91677.1 hypothetical protein test1122_08025 [Streptomyces gobiensis]
MLRTTRVATAAVTASLITAVFTGCGDDGADIPPTPGTPSPTAEATVTVRSSDLGEILVDGEGRTLYLFEADERGVSSCYNACARAWPPLLTADEPEAGRGVDEDLLGTTTREDGTIGVTYNDHPLYRYQGDEEPGDTKGQGLGGFGAEWYVLNPEGDRVKGRTQRETPRETDSPGPY